MEEQSQKTRYQKKKKLRKGRSIFFVLLLVILGLLIYSYVQYNSGLNLASESKIPAEDFAPDEGHPTIENFLILGVKRRFVI